MKRMGLLASLVALAFVAQPRQAQASLIVDFSITNQSISPLAVQGTVTGEILGLSDNYVGPGTVLIESFPAGMASTAGPTPINTSLWGIQRQNEFAIDGNGNVTYFAFSALGGSMAPNYYVLDMNSYANGGETYVSLDGYNTLFVYGGEGLPSVTFTSNQGGGGGPNSTPEPAPLTLLGAGLAALGGVHTFRRRRQLL
jgi:hypothetical protein